MKLKLIFAFGLSVLLCGVGWGQVKVEDTGVVTIGTATGTEYGLGDAKLDLVSNQNDKGIGLNVNHVYTSNGNGIGQHIRMYNLGSGDTYGLRINLDDDHNSEATGVDINLKENGTATEPIYGIHNKAYLEGSGNQSAGIKVLARCNTSSVGSKYGLHVFLKKTGGGFGTGSRYAIYAKVNSTDTDHFAGFFDGNVCINGSLNHGSDRRLKQNIRSLDNALSMVLSLAPKRYDFRDNIFGVSLPMGEQVGLIAQEVEVILPEIVKEVRVASSPEEGEDTSGMELLDSYKTINYQSLVPVLVGAIKEQQQIIQDLEARIQALEQ